MNLWQRFVSWLQGRVSAEKERKTPPSQPPQRARLVEVERSRSAPTRRRGLPTPQPHKNSRDTPITLIGSKLGIHSLRPANCINYAQQVRQLGTRFPVVKAVDDVDWLADIKAIDTNTITIARFEIGGNIGEGVNGVENVTNGDYSLFVDTLFAPILQKLQVRPDLKDVIDYWEICNEPDPPGADGWRKLAECMIACIARAEQIGIKLAIFAINAGTPEWWEMQAIVDTGVFAHAKAGGHIMTAHEAVFGFENGGWNNPITLWYGHPIPVEPSQQQWVQVRENGLFFFDYDPASGDRPTYWDAGVAGPLIFRYRFLYQLLQQRNQVIPLVISEMVYGGGYADAFDTAQRAEWYDRQLADDYYVLAHLPFTLGSYGNVWTDQEYNYAYPSFIQYMVSVRERVNADKPLLPPGGDQHKIYLPAVVKQAIPNRPEPVLDRVVILNLLPKIATLDEKIQVLTATHGDKQGVVQSAIDVRDLVVQGLAGSYAIIWEPSRWSSDIGAFMREGFVTYELRGLPEPDHSQPSISPYEAPHPIILNLLPQNATLAEKRIVAERTHARREPILQSADDAISLYRLGTSGSRVKVWSPDRWQGDILQFLRDNGVWIEIEAFRKG